METKHGSDVKAEIEAKYGSIFEAAIKFQKEISDKEIWKFVIMIRDKASRRVLEQWPLNEVIEMRTPATGRFEEEWVV